MHKYEMAHIIECEGKKDEEIQSVIGQVRTLIGNLGGRIVKEDVWGAKELTYEINKQNHGFYMFTIMTIEPTKMMEFEKRMKLIEGSMRYLLINLDNEPGYNMEQQLELADKSAKAIKEEATEASDETEKEATKPEKKVKAKVEKVEMAEKVAKEEEVKVEKKEEKVEVKDEKEEEKKEVKTEKVKKTEEKEEKKEKPKKEEKTQAEIDKLIDEKLNEIL